ncbi:MAG: glycosyltransferase family 39 protein [bacterium]|nr:glycosyltransferase family 39 protein [bacterium]
MQKFDLIIILMLFLTTFFILSATSGHYGLAWDEPYNFQPAIDAYRWLKLLFTHPTQAISDTAITQYWFKIHEHPSFSKLITGIMHGWFAGIFGDLYAFRLAEFILFGLLIVLIYLFTLEHFDRSIALFSSVAFFLMPRIFGQAHFATTDIPLTLLWFATVFCFYKGLASTGNDQQRWKWSVITGLIWGIGLATKINVLFLPIPLFLWAQLYRRKEYGTNAFCMLFISPIVFFLTWPWLWFDTKHRIMEYLFFYAQHKFTTVYYFGKMYLLVPAPWHYPLVYTLTTIPLTMLILIGIAMFTMIWEKMPNAKFLIPNVSKQNQVDFKMLILFNAMFPILLQSTPATPKYDGIRLFLPAFPYLAILAGIGFKYLQEGIKIIISKQFGADISLPYISIILSIILLVFPVYHVIDSHPYQLSYYNQLVGGINGALRKGLESTYWCEAVNCDVLRYLNRLVPENGKVRFLSFSDEVVQWYQEQDYLRKDIQCFSSEEPEYYILHCRQGFFGALEWYLYNTATPIKSFGYKSTVPLVLVYKNRSKYTR